MTEHVTISLDATQLESARREAIRFGVSLEAYLSRLVEGALPQPPRQTAGGQSISAIFGIGASAEETDIGRDKDKMLGDAMWLEHLRTRP